MTDETIISLRDQAAEKFSDFPFLSSKTEEGWKELSFADAKEYSDDLASELIARGFKAGDRAAIIAEGSPDWVISELGLIRAGCVSVPLSLKLLPEEISFRVNHCSAKAIFFSALTWEKVLSVRGEFRQEILYVLLSDSEELAEKVAGAGNLVIGKNLLLFHGLLTEGEISSLQAADEMQKRLKEMKPDDTVNICYTSGTTGNPKGILLSHKNYVSNVEGALTVLPIPLHYRTLIMLPIDHSFAHTVAIYGALLRAMTLYFVDSRNGMTGLIHNIPANLQETNPHVLLTVPSITGNFMKRLLAGINSQGPLIRFFFYSGLKAVVASRRNGFKRPGFLKLAAAFFPSLPARALIFPKLRRIFGANLKFFVSGGALLDSRQQEFFNALGIPAYQGYGLTEASPIISTNAPSRHKFGTSGNILPNITVKIVDESGREVPRGRQGEIMVHGPSVMKGYLDNPEATAKALVNGWLKTGDLGHIDEDGFLVVSGREKALLISADGEKFSPEEIEESLLSSSEWISQIMLCCDHKNYTVALVSPDRGKLKHAADSGLSSEEILGKIDQDLAAFRQQKNIKGRIPSLWLPVRFQLVPRPFDEASGMINSTLKMVRFKITETYKNTLDYLYTDEARNPVNPENLKTLSGIFKYF